MDNTQALNRSLETLAWGLLFIWLGIWWGIIGLREFLPGGTGAFGIGLILLGLNGARWLKGISISLFSTSLGIFFLVLGGLKLARVVLHLPPFELPLCGIFLIVLGAILLSRELLQARERSFGT